MGRGLAGAATAGARIRHELVGTISSAGFESGHRFVVGWWTASPVGPLRDVMWARPDGERVLLVEHERGGAFISGVYRFDRVADVGAFDGDADERSLRLRAGPVTLELRAGAGWRLPLPARRPPWFTRWVEGPVARAAMGVRTYGVSPTGVREWYRADTYRPLVAASATVDGEHAGALVPFTSPAAFGFSEPPRRPSMVRVRPLLEDPTGRLDDLAR